MKNKFKVGDRVREKDIGEGTIIGIGGWTRPYLVSFDNWNGGHDGNNVCIKIGNSPKKGIKNCWWCHEEDLTLLSSEPTITEHIVKDNKVIIKLSNGKVGVAKCCPEDEFDVYTGTQLALERAYGKENKEVREVQRKAKVGEYIKIVKPFASFGNYNVGDILEVIGQHGIFSVKVKELTSISIRDDEYVVLENYKPKKTQLTLNNGQYGIVGQKTKLVDLYGNELFVGDTVEHFSNVGSYGETVICNDKTSNDFVMGIVCSSSSIKNGISDNGWVIIKKRSYKDFKDGDIVNDVKYTLTEVK